MSSQSSFKPPGATAGQMPPLSPISPVDVSRVGHLRINSSTHSGGQMGPVLSTRTDLHNPGHAKLQSTKLAGRGNIACFYIGGEARCCLPLILNSILDQISLHAINLSCDELQVLLISTILRFDPIINKLTLYVLIIRIYFFEYLDILFNLHTRANGCFEKRCNHPNQCFTMRINYQK